VDVKTWWFKLLGEQVATRYFGMPVAEIQNKAAIENLFTAIETIIKQRR
jgi:hypothetical protein